MSADIFPSAVTASISCATPKSRSRRDTSRWNSETVPFSACFVHSASACVSSHAGRGGSDRATRGATASVSSLALYSMSAPESYASVGKPRGFSRRDVVAHVAANSRDAKPPATATPKAALARSWKL